jgi:hypothetical protein
MKTSAVSSMLAGLALAGSFAISIYIGLYDTTLAQEDPFHHDINWALGIITLIAGIILIGRTKSTLLKMFSGIVWPVLYLLSLEFDVQTELCFGTQVHCWPSVSDAYKYLILNERVEGWVLSPYTMRINIALLVIAIVFTAMSLTISILSSRRVKKSGETTPRIQGSTETSKKLPESM